MRRLLSRVSSVWLVLASMVGLIGYYALVTRLWFAPFVRRMFAVRFATVPVKPGEALAIWLHNSKLALGITICLILARLVRRLTAGKPLGVAAAPLVVCDAILALWTAGVMLTAGVLLGAYGTVQARAFWPYAPVEICAWALLLAVYLDVRVGRAGWRKTLRGVLGAETLLAVAAVLEVFGSRL